MVRMDKAPRPHRSDSSLSVWMRGGSPHVLSEENETRIANGPASNLRYFIYLRSLE